MINWQAHYDAIYSKLGVAATLVISETDASYSVTVKPMLDGIAVADDVAVSSVKPIASVRLYELAALGLDRSDLGNGASISFSGQTWKISGTQPRPSAVGEADGELALILSE